MDYLSQQNQQIAKKQNLQDYGSQKESLSVVIQSEDATVGNMPRMVVFDKFPIASIQLAAFAT